MSLAQNIIVQVSDDKNDDQNDSQQGTYRSTLEEKQPELLKSKSFYSFLLTVCQCFTWQKFIHLFRFQRKTTTQYSPFMMKNAIKVPDQVGKMIGRKTLVLDLDETLVHSSFIPIPDPDLQFNLQLDGNNYTVFVRIRPGAFEFLRLLSQDYEIVIYTASISEYANPVIDYIDPLGVVSLKLFRENCTFFKNVFVKDLVNLNRDIKNLIIVDNSPNSFMFQPNNAFQIQNFFDDMNDQELYYLLPFFKLLKDFNDVRPVQEWWYKFTNFEQFDYTNDQGQNINYQMKEDDFNVGDEVQQSDLDQIRKVQQSPNNPLSNRQNHLTMEDLSQAQNMQETPDQCLQTPKTEEQLDLIHIKNKRKSKSSVMKQKSIIMHPNREFMQELDDRLGINTEGADNTMFDKQKYLKQNSSQELDFRDEDMMPGNALRFHLNINSPKDSNQKQVIFPQLKNQETSQEFSKY